MATTLDCLLHPIDCANASAAAHVVTGSVGAASGAVSGTTSGAEIEAGNIAASATAPLHEVASTSMWITIGVVAVALVILVVFGYIVYRVELA